MRMECMRTHSAYDLSELNEEQLKVVYNDIKSQLFLSFLDFKNMSQDCLLVFDCSEGGCYPSFTFKNYVKTDVVNALDLFKEDLQEEYW